MIKDLKSGDFGIDVFMCVAKESKTASNGKAYYDLTLCDSSGEIPCKVWDVSLAPTALKAGSAIRINYSISEYKSQVQMKANSIELLDQNGYDITKLCPASPFDTEKLFSGLIQKINSVQNEYLLKLLRYFFEDEDFVDKFKKQPAAVGFHHAFVGGLLQHTFFVTSLACAAGRLYSFVNSDLLITAAILHDIGKVEELQQFPVKGFTSDGNYLGHIILGQNMVLKACERIPGFPEDLATKICHCIVSHHGELEYGSPVKPVLVEACIIHLCDMLDAKTEMFKEIFDNSTATVDESGFYQKSYALGTRVTSTVL